MTDNNEHTPAGDETAAQPWTPPSTLTPPSSRPSGLPVMALLAALGVSLAAGLALWVSSQLIYIYIFCNLLIGGAVGWALSLAPKRAGFTNVPALMVPGVLLCALPYALTQVGFVLQWLPDFQAEDPSFTFGALLVLLLENNAVFGVPIGLIGSVVLFFVETGITIYAAHGRLRQGINEARIASVPPDVVDFVIHGFAHGWDTARVRSELSQRGWPEIDDQDRAIGTGFDVIAALQAGQASA